MFEYIFLFGITFIWLAFASIQDLKSTEISDWLTFSLLIIGLGYRAVFAIITHDSNFFWLGILGALLFMGVSYVMYYGGFFAGGDAKLLISLGAILPFERMLDYAVYGGGFVLLLLLVGAFYTILFSAYLVFMNFKGFKKAFDKNFDRWKVLVYIGLVLVLIFAFVNYLMALIVFVVGVLLLYLKSVEDGCMIKLTRASALREGDWLVSDVLVGKKLIKKNAHGLTEEEIAFLRKNGKSVVIRNGIPFAPCFLIALSLFMLFFFSRLSHYLILF